MYIVKSILLHIVWVVHLFFQRLLSNRSDNASQSRKQTALRSPISTIIRSRKINPPKTDKAMKDIIEYESSSPHRRTSTRVRRGDTINHFLFGEKKTSLVDMSDVISPVEEEMLRCLCAKGCETNRKLRRNAGIAKAYNEICIPRDIFTNVWLNSYLTEPSQA